MIFLTRKRSHPATIAYIGTAPAGGQDQTRGKPLPQALPRPQPLPVTRTRSTTGDLTDIEASASACRRGFGWAGQDSNLRLPDPRPDQPPRRGFKVTTQERDRCEERLRLHRRLDHRGARRRRSLSRTQVASPANCWKRSPPASRCQPCEARQHRGRSQARRRLGSRMLSYTPKTPSRRAA
jgi:hypothetical protein